MASDDELKDEELVDFEGSDYELDGEYDELEHLEENEEKALKERSLNLQQTDFHYRSDVETPDKGALESSRSSALGNTESLNDLVYVGSETLETATFRESESNTLISRVAEAVIVECKSSTTAVLPKVEASEAHQRSSYGPSDCGSRIETYAATLASAKSTVLGSKKDLEMPEHHCINSVLCLHEIRKSSDTFSPSIAKECLESGDIEEEKEEKAQMGMLGLPVILGNHTSEPMNNTMRKHNNSDLEDGELDESALVMPSPQSPVFIYFCTEKHSISLVSLYFVHSFATPPLSLLLTHF